MMLIVSIYIIEQQQSTNKVPKWGLLFDYMKMNAQNPVIRLGTIKLLITSQYKNLSDLLRLYISVFLIDQILDPPSESHERSHIMELEAATFGQLNRHVGLIVIGLTYLLLFACEHYLDYLGGCFHIGGSSRNILQSNLMRKFLNYTEESRTEVSSGGLLSLSYIA